MPSPKPNESAEERKSTRRRGAALEKVLLQVAWEQLVAVGYKNFTLEAVADGARTSRPVIYRRWANRAELARTPNRSYVYDFK